MTGLTDDSDNPFAQIMGAPIAAGPPPPPTADAPEENHRVWRAIYGIPPPAAVTDGSPEST